MPERALRVGVIGGGPGGLFLARLLRLHGVKAEVTVYERNAPDATFGFGVVFSDRTLTAIDQADHATHELMVGPAPAWHDMEMRLPDRRMRFKGYGFTAIERKRLLAILQGQAAEVGATLEFETEKSVDELRGEYDLVVASDGVNSAARAQYAAEFGAQDVPGQAYYAWFGTHAPFEVVTFPFVETEHGMFAAHAYQYSDDACTFIVEVDAATWERAGMAEGAAAATAPGESDLYAKAYLERAFAEHLQGHELLVNNSKWAQFRLVNNERWHVDNVVLLGDAAHTAHFSVGSGTKLAMEDSIALAEALKSEIDVPTALALYERRRRPDVARTQQWALPSQRWWETFAAREKQLAPEQFGFHFLTRTSAMTYRGLQRRDKSVVDAAERTFAGGPLDGNALAQPLRIGERTAPNRVLAVPGIDPGAAAAAGAGVAIIAADQPELADAVAAVERSGALAGVQAPAGDADAIRRAIDAAPAFVELLLAPGEELRVDPATVQEASPLPVVVALSVPLVDAWAPEGQAIVDAVRELAQAGVWGVRVIADASGGDAELRAQSGLPGITLADRFKTELGLSVAVTVAPGWAYESLDVREPWPVQAHVALVSGRVDLIAGWPLLPGGEGGAASAAARAGAAQIAG